MKYYLYILKSLSDGKHYIGQTSDIRRRLEEHNRGRVRWTKNHLPWMMIHFEEYRNRTEAIKREHFLKSPQGWKELSYLKEKGRGFPEGITS